MQANEIQLFIHTTTTDSMGVVCEMTQPDKMQFNSTYEYAEHGFSVFYLTNLTFNNENHFVILYRIPYY